MLDLSMSKIVVILVVELIVVGPRQLTEPARVVGRLHRDLQKIASQIRQNIHLEMLASPSPHKEAPISDTNDRAGNQKSGSDSGPPLGQK